MRLFQNRLKAESGRTLLEMLGVLSVMAVLTIGGVVGYQALTLRFETRTIAETITRHVVERQHEAMTKKGQSAHEKLNVEGPHGVFFDISNDIVNQLVVIKIKTENSDLIQSLLKSDVLKADAYSMDTPTLTDGAPSVVMRFKQFPQAELVADSAITCSAGEECVQCTNEYKPNWDGVKCVCTANSCGEGYICANGECLPCHEVDNYEADGSGVMDEGTVCCPDGYETAVGGMCCPTDAPYCKEVNYLQSSGSQWIDTGISAPNGYKGNIDLAVVSNITQVMVGVQASQQRNFLITNSGKFKTGIGNTEFIGPSFNLDTKYNLDYSTEDNYYLNVDGVQSFAGTITGKTRSAWTLGLFAEHSSGTSIRYQSRIKVYIFKLWLDDTLVRDFIPVIDNFGEAGMYDKVKGKMYYNQGSGHFTVG